MNDVTIKLIGYSSSGVDAFLQPIETKTETEILAVSVPVSRSEFYRAGQLGINPEYLFEINPAEYSGQRDVDITENGMVKHLKIYRTYESSADVLELYCQAAAGLDPEPVSEGGDD